jgi:hypothetical protein
VGFGTLAKGSARFGHFAAPRREPPIGPHPTRALCMGFGAAAQRVGSRT